MSRNFWHHIGGLACKDEDGIFYFEGRKKDYIRYEGRNIALAEVEMAVAQFPKLSALGQWAMSPEETELGSGRRQAAWLPSIVDLRLLEVLIEVTEYASHARPPGPKDFGRFVRVGGQCD